MRTQATGMGKVGARLGLAAAFLTAILACSGGEAGPPVLTSPPPEETRQEAAPWIAAESLPDLDCEEHGATLSWLALEAPPPVEAQAMDALVGCPDAPDREALAAYHLGSPDAAVAGAALRLAAAMLAERPPSAEDPLVGGIAASTQHEDRAVRYEAVVELDSVPWTSSVALEAAMLQAAGDPSPPVVSEVLHRAYDRAGGLRQADAWAMTARYALMAHLDPGIRGRGALLLGRLRPASKTTRRLLRDALDDDHPHVRAVAATALSEAGDLAAVHLFAERLRETGAVQVEANWAMLPWEGTDGETRTQVHEGSYFERVDDAMLRAAAELTEGLDEPYVLRDINLRYLELDLVGASRDLQSWYEAHGDQLPSLE